MLLAPVTDEETEVQLAQDQRGGRIWPPVLLDRIFSLSINRDKLLITASLAGEEDRLQSCLPSDTSGKGTRSPVTKSFINKHL